MEPFIGMIVQFGGNFAPRGWALCDGQLLAISNNSALFSILGTTYGGDGVQTFALPDLRGRVPMHPGNGPGLSPRRLGQKGGAETVTLTINQMPAHHHSLNVNSDKPSQEDPRGNLLSMSAEPLYSDGAATGTASPGAISNAGGGQSVSIVQPFLAVNFIIALVGLYPSRS